jgi:5-methylcytosine-specific restriction endonuclease McrA
MNLNDLLKLKDNQLLENFSHVVKQEREAISAVVAHLAEIEKRKLYAKSGYPSLFTYVTKKYHYSESAAFRRIQAARLSLKFPHLLELLENGKLNLMSLSLVAPYLTEGNEKEVIANVIGKSKREVEFLISSITQKPIEIRADKIRRISIKKPILEAQVSKTSASSGLDLLKCEHKENAAQDLFKFEGENAQKVTTTGGSGIKEEREVWVKIDFFAKEGLATKIERAREILRHKHPQGKLGDIFDEVLEFYLEKKAPERKIARIEKAAGVKEEKSTALTPKGNQKEERSVQGVYKDVQEEMNEEIQENNEREKDLRSSKEGRIQTRYIPQEIRREVWKRDGGECGYRAPDGRRCQERGGIEIDHRIPFSLGGESTVENLQLLCRTHNQWRAFKSFGESYRDRFSKKSF